MLLQFFQAEVSSGFVICHEFARWDTMLQDILEFQESALLDTRTKQQESYPLCKGFGNLIHFLQCIVHFLYIRLRAVDRQNLGGVDVKHFDEEEVIMSNRDYQILPDPPSPLPPNKK